MSQSDATLLHSRAVRIFVSYSHKDEPQYPQPHEFKWLSYVQSELAPLAASGDVEYWTDESNKGGMDWDTRIKQALETCDIFVLLVSPNSLSSEYIIRTEVPAILQRQQECESKEQPALFPLVIRTVDQGVLDSFEWLRTPNRRPPNGKALSEFRLDGTIDQRGPEMQRVLSDLRELASRISDNQAIETGCHSHCKRSKPDLEEQPGDTRGPVVHPPYKPEPIPCPCSRSQLP